MQDPQYLEQLARRLVDLDEAAYQEFATIFGPLLIRYMLRHGLPYFEAEDLAATLVTDIALKVRKYRPGGSFSGWVFAIARNRLFDQRRRVLLKVESNEEPLALLDEELLTDLEVTIELQAALADLSENDRVIVLGRALNGRPYKELAGELNITEEVARTRYFRARRVLSERLVKMPLIQKKIERNRINRNIA